MKLRIKNAEIDSAESAIRELQAEWGTPYDGDKLGEVCKRCHEKGRHRIQKCTNPPCISIKQCGRLDKHKDEEKLLKKEKNPMGGRSTACHLRWEPVASSVIHSPFFSPG